MIPRRPTSPRSHPASAPGGRSTWWFGQAAPAVAGRRSRSRPACGWTDRGPWELNTGRGPRVRASGGPRDVPCAETCAAPPCGIRTWWPPCV